MLKTTMIRKAIDELNFDVYNESNQQQLALLIKQYQIKRAAWAQEDITYAQEEQELLISLKHPAKKLRKETNILETLLDLILGLIVFLQQTQEENANKKRGLLSRI